VHETIRSAPEGAGSPKGLPCFSQIYRLPPDPRSADPLQSQVRALVHLLFMPTQGQPGRVLDNTTAQLLPLQYAYSGPRVRPFAPQTLDGREFNAWLDPGASLLAPDFDFSPPLIFVQLPHALLRKALKLSERWLAMPPVELRSLLRDIVEQITVAADRIEIQLSRAKIAAALQAGGLRQQPDLDPVVAATAWHFSRHLRMNALRFASISGFEAA
jgi:hypothetical protein